MTGNINMGTNKIQVSSIGNYFDLNNGQFWWSSSADVTIDMVNQTLYSTGYSHTSIDWHAENLQHVGTIIADWHTGYLTLNADPISNLGAATKHYVDSKTGSTSGIVFLTSIQTLTNKTISGSSNTLSNIANTSLVNSSITINGSSVSLGSSTTITANLNNALTVGTGLILNSGITFDGSSAKTLTIDNVINSSIEK